MCLIFPWNFGGVQTPKTPPSYDLGGGIFKYDFVANLPLSLSVKEFWKSVDLCRSYGQEFSVLFFDSRCRFSFRTYCQHCSATARCGLLLQMSHVPWYLCLSVGHGRAWALQKRWTDRVTRCHLGRLTQAQGTMYWTEGPDWPHLANTTERSVLDAA